VVVHSTLPPNATFPTSTTARCCAGGGGIARVPCALLDFPVRAILHKLVRVLI